jgi:outer membrane receptor protein involved in Fe transport
MAVENQLRTIGSRGAAGVAGVLLSCLCLYAQNTGTLRGRVTDRQGAPLPGAVITLRSDKNPSVNSVGAVADGRGDFRLQNLPPGDDYRVSASFPGMATVIQGPIQIHSGATSVVTFIMVQELVTTLKVQAQGSIVDTTTAATTTVINEAFIETLPILGRTFTDLLTLAPGVTDTDGDGKVNVHGAREVDFQTRLDGVNVTDPFSGEETAQINIEAIEEVQILTTGGGAEYGRFQGGVGIVTTKSGGNEFEGSFKLYYQTRSLDGDGAHNQDAVSLEEELSSFRTLKPFLTVGGALRRDRLWYFLANQYIDQEEPLNILGFQRNYGIEGWNEFGKLTWQINPSHKGVLEGLYDPREVTGNNLGLGISSLSDYTVWTTTPVVTARESWVATPAVLLESAFSYLNGRQRLEPVAELPNDSLRCPLITDPVKEANFCGRLPSWNYTVNLRTNQVEGPYWVSQDSDASRLTVKEDLSFYVDDLLGSHQFKAGFEWGREDYDTTVEQRPLRYDLQPPRGGGDQVVLFADFENRTQGAEARADTLGVYFQDTWSIRPNLTLNLGLRLDLEDLLAPGQEPIDPAAERAAFDALAQMVYSNVPVTPEEYAQWREAAQPFRGCSGETECQQLGTDPLPCDIAGPNLGPPDGFCDRWDRIAASRTFSRHEAEQGTSNFFTQDEVEFEIPACGSPDRWGTCRGDDDIDITNTNLAPRFSISYDPFADGKTKLWASYGRFYDRLFLEAFVPEQARDFTYLSFFRRTQDELLHTPTQKNYHTYTVSRDLRTPYVDEFTVGFQRELTPEFAVSARYIRRKGEDQLQKRDINHFTVDLDQDGLPDDLHGDAATGGAALGPDGFADLYPYNPFFGAIFIVGNFNTSDYRGFEITFTRRLHRQWQFDASYTYSEALGNAEAFEDIYLGSDTSQVEHEFGYLSYDQRHTVKFNAVAHLPKQIQFGTRILWESGLPFSLVRRDFTFDSLGNPTYRQIFPTEQRNDQRNEGRWLIDVNLRKAFTLGRAQAGAELTVTNLLNSDDLEIGNINDAAAALQLISGTERRFGRRFQLGFSLNF